MYFCVFFVYFLVLIFLGGKLVGANFYAFATMGKNRAIPKETTVLTMKEILPYIVKLAESEKESLDLSNGELSLCFDADAGE